MEIIPSITSVWKILSTCRSDCVRSCVQKATLLELPKRWQRSKRMFHRTFCAQDSWVISSVLCWSVSSIRIIIVIVIELDKNVSKEPPSSRGSFRSAQRRQVLRARIDSRHVQVTKQRSMQVMNEPTSFITDLLIHTYSDTAHPLDTEEPYMST